MTAKTKPKRAYRGAFDTVKERRARLKEEPAHESVDSFLQEHALSPANDYTPGAKLFHLIKNQVSKAATAYRPALHECVLIALLPNRAKVRFKSGIEKVVKFDSLYKKESA